MTQIRTRRQIPPPRAAVPHELFLNRREHRRSGAGEFVTLCRLGLGDPWVTPGPPKRHAWVSQGSNEGSTLFTTKIGKCRSGEALRRSESRNPGPRCNKKAVPAGCYAARSPGQSGENGSSGKAE